MANIKVKSSSWQHPQKRQPNIITVSSYSSFQQNHFSALYGEKNVSTWLNIDLLHSLEAQLWLSRQFF
jgi:hypothetical protein